MRDAKVEYEEVEVGKDVDVFYHIPPVSASKVKGDY